MKTINEITGLVPIDNIDPDTFQLATIAASRKIRGRGQEISSAHLDIDEEDKVETNTDPSLKDGFWVRIWLFVSQDEIDNAKDTTP